MDEIAIRRHLEPGDVGALVSLQARSYAAEHGLDARFEADVARGLGDAVRAGWPAERGAVWLAEAAGRLVGSLAVTDEGPRRARLRWFILAPEARGRGLGRRLLGDALAWADAAGYATIELETFSDLRAAAHLYRSSGFERVHAQPEDRWGPTLLFERYERRAPVPAATGGGGRRPSG